MITQNSKTESKQCQKLALETSTNNDR